MKLDPTRSPQAFEFACHSAACAPPRGGSLPGGGPRAHSTGSYGASTAKGTDGTKSAGYARMKARELVEQRNAARKRAGLPTL